jgi:hypothetical protein
MLEAAEKNGEQAMKERVLQHNPWRKASSGLVFFLLGSYFLFQSRFLTVNF